MGAASHYGGSDLLILKSTATRNRKKSTDMKHIIPFILLVFLTSCGVTNVISYGDVSLLNTNGEMIQKWDNSTLGTETYDNYSGQQISYSHPLKNSGLNFTDKDGETHYISGGIIIVNNIRTTKYSEPAIQTSDNTQTSEYENLKKQYSEKKQYLKNNTGKFSDKELESIKLEMKVIKGKIQAIENTLYDHTNED